MSATFTDAGAIFSHDRRYRYHLHRTWSQPLLAKCDAAQRHGFVLFIMLNPSTADEHVLDPTLRRCHGFARAWGFSRFDICNLFALRSTDPRALYTSADPIGDRNDVVIASTARDAARVVVAWGKHGALRGRDAHVLRLLRALGVQPYRLRVNGDGTPAHPLYLPAGSPLTLHEVAR